MASWFPADEPPIAAPLTEPVPLAPLEPTPAPEAAGSMPPPVTQEPAPAAPALTTPALPPAAMPQPPAVARPPLTVVSKPAVAPAPKKRGWSLLSLLGFGGDDVEPAARPVSVASAVPLSGGPAVAIEPLHNGGRAAPSTDDVNVEKDREGI